MACQASKRDLAADRQRGFTLVELLAVILILGVVSGIALLSVDLAGGQVKVAEESRRFAELLRLQCEEAVLQARDFGVHMSAEGYAFSGWDGTAWAPRGERVFRARQLPPGVTMELFVGGRPALDEALEQPQLVCFASGEMTPFQLSFRGPGQALAQVAGDPLGRLELESP